MSPVPVSVLRHASLPDGSLVDVLLEDGVVADVVDAGTGRAAEAVDLEGRLLLPAGADAHAHLDKAYTWDAIQPPFGDLVGAIDAFHSFQENLTEEDIHGRARRAALRLLANGTTAIRSHVNLLPGDSPFRGVDALVRLRAELRDVLDLQLVALPPVGMDDALVEESLARGLDLVGGAPHLAEDPIDEVRRMVAIAERRGTGIDLHTDESLDGPVTIGEFARLVEGWEPGRLRTAGHCVRLGTLPSEELAPLIDAVVQARLGVVSLPITNLYLQGWDQPVGTPRGLTALAPLLEAGALVSAGADNVRDPFNPLGRSDACETAMLLVTAGHLDLETAWHLVSNGGRAVMGLPRAAAEPGAAADFVAMPAANVGEAIAEAPADRIVLHRGRVVARTAVQQQIHVPVPTEGSLHA
ncbi:amidohydrolase family protein [Demequina mangrovi]|uniref:Cytosine deaminase n=1 Tax=Demequina mangrovi TaxID=1043493 RepID=A0A1H7AFF7_9MICO|nr:amidohydrolase family protein [Demequina mangrovi]SEJ59725.1 cytosine deaminase [Demequina mangrovi]